MTQNDLETSRSNNESIIQSLKLQLQQSEQENTKLSQKLLLVRSLVSNLPLSVAPSFLFADWNGKRYRDTHSPASKRRDCSLEGKTCLGSLPTPPFSIGFRKAGQKFSLVSTCPCCKLSLFPTADFIWMAQLFSNTSFTIFPKRIRWTNLVWTPLASAARNLLTK